MDFLRYRFCGAVRDGCCSDVENEPIRVLVLAHDGAEYCADCTSSLLVEVGHDGSVSDDVRDGFLWGICREFNGH
ncbi:hypothetical protein D3C85_1797640 [compost metagenome]